MSRHFTEANRHSKERSLERDITRFSGYGDRVGSGVEFAPNFWTGGELVTDPTLVNKSLKPRRMYYSPIGDGVVAADGVEMKRAPRDTTPRVSVTHQRIVEKSNPGRDGVRITERQWTSGGDGGSVHGGSRAGSEFGGGFPESGRDSRATNVASPLGSLADPMTYANNLGGQPPAGPGTSGYGASPGRLNTGPLGDIYRTPTTTPSNKYDTLGSRDPYSTLGSTRSEPPKNDYLNGLGPDSRYGSINDFGGPQSGRTSTTSALLSEPGMRYEMKKDYKISNPKELIHQYATQTPIQTIDGFEQLPDAGVTRTVKSSYHKTTTEETYSPYPPYHAQHSDGLNPLKFVRQIRDEGLTSRQHQANQNVGSLVQGDVFTDRKVQEIQQQTQTRNRHVPDVDTLTDRLMLGLQTGHPTPPKF